MVNVGTFSELEIVTQREKERIIAYTCLPMSLLTVQSVHTTKPFLKCWN